MVILATKLYGDDTDAAMQSLESLIQNQLGDLEVTTDIGVRHDGFPSVTLAGEDETVARNVLTAEWGEITDTFETGQRYRGVLDDWSPEGIVIDAGQSVHIPTANLELGSGQADQILTRFGLVRYVPLWFEYGSPSTLAIRERDRLFSWRRGPGRVTANGLTRSQLRATVNRAGHADDIQTIERLGLLEQSILCHPETDPPGLLASIGPHVPGDLACVIP